MTQQLPGSNIDNALRCTLDRHGYGFQYAVLRKIKDLFEQRPLWMLEVAEFPVTTGTFDTRIDFIVRPKNFRFFLVAECKRANPAFSNWCFVKAPFVRRGGNTERLFVEHAVVEAPDGDSPMSPAVSARGTWLDESVSDVFHIGIEVKHPRGKDTEKGDPGGGRNAIEEAAGQVLRGVNGLVNTLTRINPRNWQNRHGGRVATTLMPVIFTTAKLWKSSVDLGSADIATGKLAEGSLEPVETPWLFYQYAMSPALKHPHSVMTTGYEFAELLEPDCVRTIAVVNANGLESFFREFHHYENGVTQSGREGRA